MAWTPKGWLSQVQWCQLHQEGAPGTTLLPFAHPSFQFILHTSSHLWMFTSALLTPSDLYTPQDFARTEKPTFLHDSISACPHFQASGSHANWIPLLYSIQLRTCAGGGHVQRLALARASLLSHCCKWIDVFTEESGSDGFGLKQECHEVGFLEGDLGSRTMCSWPSWGITCVCLPRWAHQLRWLGGSGHWEWNLKVPLKISVDQYNHAFYRRHPRLKTRLNSKGP